MAHADQRSGTSTRVVGFLSGLVLGAGLGVSFGSRAVPSAASPVAPEAAAPPAANEPSAAASGIADRLDRLTEVLAARARPVASQPAAHPPMAGSEVERVAVAADVGQLDLRIAALERAVGQLRSRVDGPAVAELAHGGNRPTRWEELRAAMDALHSADEARQTATRQRIMLRTPEQILELFGRPTDATADQLGRMVWRWADRSTDRVISVTFVDGLAVFGW